MERVIGIEPTTFGLGTRPAAPGSSEDGDGQEGVGADADGACAETGDSGYDADEDTGGHPRGD